MKYSINSHGFIVAERDIYSLGGFIPRNSVGAKVANKDQISQYGECWVAGGDISGRPDVRVKGNAYIGYFVGNIGMHTDGVTEFSGDTLIPGKISVQNPIADPVNDFFAKDSFIGISMDVLCGPSTTATAFPFEQGDFRAEAAKGALFASASMKLDDPGACRNTSVLRLGLNTYLYLPAGYRARVFWTYFDNSSRLAYSGESEAIRAGLTKLNHSVYRLAMVSIAKSDGTAMAPTDLLAAGVKIFGHISGSANVDIRPESVSGDYVMNNSSLIVKTSNFGLNATQLRFLAGGLFDSTMYTPDDRGDYKTFGMFHNVKHLEYTKYLGDAHRTNVNRDTYISAYDCPLLRVDDTTYNDSLAAKGNLTLRRCVVPKAEFQDDVMNGNSYEDIDFSYANEDLGFTIEGYTRFISSHKQGIYRLSDGPGSAGFVSHKGNLADTARLFQEAEHIPLDGSIMEQGLYRGSQALDTALRIIDSSKVPEITGSAYVGAGCTVRGDVQLHGEPYVKRVLDVNMWERGSGDTTTGRTWEAIKRPDSVEYQRLRTRDVFPVDVTVDNDFTCTSGYEMLIYYFGEDGKCSGYSSWGRSLRVSDPAVAYISILVKKGNGTELLDLSDIPLANVKYVRAFKKRRYIVNELDRTSPEDILLSVGCWEQVAAGVGQADAGKTYEELKATSGTTIRPKRPINVSPTSSISSASEIPNSGRVLEFVPQPRIIVPYGGSNVLSERTKVRMYDNSVISRTITKGMCVILKDDAVLGSAFTGDVCMCSNGHDDAVI